MTGKHTPGPWNVYDYGERPGIESDGLSIVGWGNESDFLGVHGKTRDEVTANARLIAAAPDLLDACRLALAALDADQYVAAEILEETLRAAIAKAVDE